MRPSILLPWNLGSYQAMNGFHPLFRDWLKLQAGVDLVRMCWGHEVSQHSDAWAHEIADDIAQDGLGPLFEHEDFRRFYSIFEYDLASRVKAAAEFHHTVPFTRGRRPFFFHCEAVAPMLMPFLYQGREISDPRIPAAIEVLRALFESDRCLAIYSHLRQTLAEFTSTFGSPEIDRKLRYMPLVIGPDVPFACDKQKTLTFLFTNSSHQALGNFALRGAALAVQIFDQVRDRVPDARLIVAGRAAKSFFATQLSAGIADGVRAAFERNREQILWVEGWQTEASIDRLYRSADFLLLPSVDLHSASLLRAMRNGCIPIVSDAYGVNEMVEHGRTGLVMNMLDREISSVREFGFTNSNHASFLSRQEEIATRASRECARFMEQIVDPAARRALRQRMMATTPRRFGHVDLYREFHDLLQSHGIKQSSGDIAELAAPLDCAADFGPARGRPVARWQGLEVYRYGNTVIGVGEKQWPSAASLDAFAAGEGYHARYSETVGDALHHLLRSRKWRKPSECVDVIPLLKLEAGVALAPLWQVMVGAGFTLLPPASAEQPDRAAAIRLRLVCCARTVGAGFDVGLRCDPHGDHLHRAIGGRLNAEVQLLPGEPLPAGGWVLTLRAEELGLFHVGDVVAVGADGQETVCDFAALPGLRRSTLLLLPPSGDEQVIGGAWSTLDAGNYTLEWCAFADGDGDPDEAMLAFELVSGAQPVLRKAARRRDLGDTRYTRFAVSEAQAARPLEFRVSHYGRDRIGLSVARLQRID